MKHVSNIYQTCSKHLSNMYQIFIKHLSQTSQTFIKDLSNIYETYIKHVSIIYQTFRKRNRTCIERLPHAVYARVFAHTNRWYLSLYAYTLTSFSMDVSRYALLAIVSLHVLATSAGMHWPSECGICKKPSFVDKSEGNTCNMYDEGHMGYMGYIRYMGYIASTVSYTHLKLPTKA